MKRVLLICAFLICASCGYQEQQKYSIGQFSVSLYDPNQPLHRVEGVIYYPSNAPKGQKFPAIVFSPGYVSDEESYGYLWTELVPKGYVMALESSYDSDPVSLPLWKARDEAFLLEYMRNESLHNPKSPLYNMIGDTAAVSGHSEGGAASLISAYPAALDNAYNVNWTSVLVLSGCFGFVEVDLLKIAVQHDKMPVMWITGTADCICPPEPQAQYYSESPSSCKYFANLNKGSHCYWFNPPEVGQMMCWDLEILDGCGFEEMMDKELQQKLTKSYALPWFDYTLKGDKDAKTLLDQALHQDQQQNYLTYKSSCSSFY